MTDPGIDDKRLLLDEREFYSALEVMKREGNILSRIVRDAWDCRAGAADADQEHATPASPTATSRSSATSRSRSCGRSSTTPRWPTATPTGFSMPASTAARCCRSAATRWTRPTWERGPGPRSRPPAASIAST